MAFNLHKKIFYNINPWISKKLKNLVSLVETSDISSLSVEEDNLKVEIKRENNATIIQQHIQTTPSQSIQQPANTAQPTAPPAEPSEANKKQVI